MTTKRIQIKSGNSSMYNFYNNSSSCLHIALDHKRSGVVPTFSVIFSMSTIAEWPLWDKIILISYFAKMSCIHSKKQTCKTKMHSPLDELLSNFSNLILIIFMHLSFRPTHCTAICSVGVFYGFWDEQ